jgi:hypothetical protein
MIVNNFYKIIFMIVNLVMTDGLKTQSIDHKTCYTSLKYYKSIGINHYDRLTGIFFKKDFVGTLQTNFSISD